MSEVQRLFKRVADAQDYNRALYERLRDTKVMRDLVSLASVASTAELLVIIQAPAVGLVHAVLDDCRATDDEERDRYSRAALFVVYDEIEKRWRR